MKVKASVKRPPLHYVIIIGYILAPIANLLSLLLIGRVPPEHIFPRLFQGYGSLAAVWLLTAPLVGIGLAFVHRASWYVFLGHSSLILIDYVIKWAIRPGFYWQTVPSLMQFGIFTGNILLIAAIGYIVQKDFRAPYFQVLKRSWREHERIPIRHSVLVDGIPRPISDISEGGCFVCEPGLDLTVGTVVDVNLKSYRLTFDCKGEVMRRIPDGVGVRFMNLTTAQRRDIRRMVKKRHFLRYQVDLQATWKTGEVTREARLADISSGGCFIDAAEPGIGVGAEVSVDIRLNGNLYTAEGSIVWVKMDEQREKAIGYGVKYHHPQKKMMRVILSRKERLRQIR